MTVARPQVLSQEGQQTGDRSATAATPLPSEVPDQIAPLLDAKGAAALLNVPATWVLAEARADRIPHVRLGRYVRFDANELQVWWLSRRRGPWRSNRGTVASPQSNGPPASETRRAA